MGDGEDMPTCAVFFRLLLVSFFRFGCAFLFFRCHWEAWLLLFWFHLEEGKTLNQAEMLSTQPCMVAKGKKASGKKNPCYPNGCVGSITIPFTMEIISVVSITWWSFYLLAVLHLDLKFLVSEWYAAGNSWKHPRNHWPALQGHQPDGGAVGPDNNHDIHLKANIQLYVTTRSALVNRLSSKSFTFEWIRSDRPGFRSLLHHVFCVCSWASYPLYLCPHL